MNISFSSLSKTSRYVILLNAVLLVYGYLCRLLNIYYFWESRTIGWLFVLVTLIFILRDRIISKRVFDVKPISEYVAVGTIVIAVIGYTSITIWMARTNSYLYAKNYLQRDFSLVNELDGINEVVFEPVFSYTNSVTHSKNFERANLNFIIKGNSKYKDVEITLKREGVSEWEIQKIR